MILADTSAWVEFDRGTGSPIHLRLRQLMTEGRLAVTEPVLMEVLAGARDTPGEQRLQQLLLRFEQLPFDAATDFNTAIQINRHCRSVGITPRGPIDCMIAAVAWRTRTSLLARDRDLEQIANVMGIRLDLAPAD